MQISDEQLMQRLADGDARALEALVNRHAKSVLNTLYRIVLSPSDAEDLCQDVFEKLWLQAPSWRPEAKLTTWLYRVASNLAINHKQRVQQRYVVNSEMVAQVSESGVDGEGAAISDFSADRTVSQDLNRALAQLPDNQRAALYFRYYHGYSTADIANILSTSSKAVESLLGRGRQALKPLIGDAEVKQ